jgi:phage tail sheath protein FI
MQQLTYPGIYTREIPTGVRSLAGAPTSVALFVGPTRTGIDGRPIRLLNYGDFERNFGGLSQTSALSYSVLHFFANGGGQAYVIRVPVNGAGKATSTLLKDGAAGDTLKVTALSSGLSGNSIFLEIDPFGIGANPYATSAPLHDRKRFNLVVSDPATGRSERFGNVTTVAASARDITKVIKDPSTGSQLLTVAFSADGADANGPQATGSIYAIGGALPAGAFANDVKLVLTVTRHAANGTADAANSISALEVTVYASGAAKPESPLALMTQVVSAINAAIRGNSTEAAKLAGAEVEGAIFEGGKFLRLRISAPTGDPGPARIHDATVTIADPASGAAGTKLLTVFGLSAQVTNPSRYRLGAAYASSQVSAATAGAAGDAHGQPNSTAFKDAVTALEVPDPFFNVLCLPDLVRPSTADATALQHANAMTVYSEAARVCKKKFAFLIVDPLPKVTDTGKAESWKTLDFTMASADAGSAGAWFPNIRVDDPLEPGAIRSHPPSGAIAGIIARTDAQVGVWQSPAGTDATLAGVYGPVVELSDAEHGILNPLGVNVIRRFPIFGTVGFGSRTVDGANLAASDWKYIPVRRTANYILRSLSEGLRWAVHKPNGEELWSQLRVSTTSFMHGLFRQGAFKGVSSRDAYFVACDASTTSADDINQGVVNIVVGFAPLKPAEFVVISLRQIVQASN